MISTGSFVPSWFSFSRLVPTLPLHVPCRTKFCFRQGFDLRGSQGQLVSNKRGSHCLVGMFLFRKQGSTRVCMFYWCFVMKGWKYLSTGEVLARAVIV